MGSRVTSHHRELVTTTDLQLHALGYKGLNSILSPVSISQIWGGGGWNDCHHFFETWFSDQSTNMKTNK